MYIPRRLEKYREGIIKPGNIIATFPRIDSDVCMVLARQAIILLNGHSYFHTGIVVEYNNLPYVLHNIPGDLIEQRKGGSYNNSIKHISTLHLWNLYLEPLCSFIEAERKAESFVSIVDTGKYLVYDEQAAKNAKMDKMFQHCSYFVGKYLEQLGLCQNKSLYQDFIYYTPEYYANHFGNLLEIEL
jgi:hypothetical protein